ncbi:hypothetical protein HYV85_06495 [Candidatus Woesearchaeota archaeon]|nr:hypothetical protein [Candidatus Woesearchaeota archaeon]
MGGESAESASGASGKFGKSGNVKAGFTLDSKTVAVLAITVLFVVSLYLWTLPFQRNSLPFGEGDSAWHFSIGDNMADKDKAAFRLPYYIGMWYYGFNSILGPFAPEYPPPNHVNYAMMQVFGGERFVPVFIYRAIASFIGALSVFFLVSRLFGVLPAFIAGLGLSFSLREQLTYLFGQQPTLTAIVVTPVTMYAWYKYLTSFYDSGSGSSSSYGKGNIVYLYVTFALLAAQYLLHFQGFTGSVILMAVFTIAMAVRFRRLPLSKSNLLPLAAAIVLFLAVAAPFAAVYFGSPDSYKPSWNLGRLLEWGISPDYFKGSFPPAFSLFSSEYPKALVPFLTAGMVLLFVRLFLVKNNVRELFLLSWLIGTYLVLHLDVFVGTGLNRLARMLVLENYVFFTLIAMGIVWLPQTIALLLKLNSGVVTVAKYVLAAILVFSLVTTSGRATYGSLSQAYSGIDRITPAQADFAANYLSKLPEKVYIYDPSVKVVGQWRYPKMRWMLAISQRHVGRYDGGPIAGFDNVDKNETYFLFDYSDIALFASSPSYQQQAAAWASQLNQLEQQLFNNTEPVYDINNIRLYKYENNAEVPA